MTNPGLCATCLHMREIRSDRGSVFTQCGRSFREPKYDKYPRLPVLACPGFEIAQKPMSQTPVDPR